MFPTEQDKHKCYMLQVNQIVQVAYMDHVSVWVMSLRVSVTVVSREMTALNCPVPALMALAMEMVCMKIKPKDHSNLCMIVDWSLLDIEMNTCLHIIGTLFV